MGWVGITANYFHVSADALGGAVSAHLGIGRCAVYLLQLCVIHVHPERAFHGFQICPLTVGGYLYAANDSAGAIFHEFTSPSGIPTANEIANAELAFWL